MTNRLLFFCFTLSALLFSGCPKQSPVQNEPPASPSSVKSPVATPAKSTALRETSEEKVVRERTEQLGGTIRKNQAGQIIGVVIESNELTLADMQLIAQLSDLESIRLKSAFLDDDFVKVLSGLTQLKSVDFESSNITDRSLEILKEFPDIETLSLRQNVKLSDNAVALFAEFPNLKTLNILYNNHLSPASLLKLGKLSSLRVLDVRGCQVGDDTLYFISKLEHLEEIRIRSNQVTNEGIEDIVNCKKLKLLELQDTSIEAGCAVFFNEMENLRNLRIFRAPQFNAKAVSELGVLTNLETLELRGLNSSNESLQALKTLTKLKTVEFSELTDVDAATIVDVLKSYPALESVRMFAMPVDDSVAEYLATIPALKSVALPATAITDKGLDVLTALKNLQTLDIHGNKELITLQGAQALTKFRNLRRLILPETLDNKDLKSTILKSSPRCVTTVKTYSQEG